MLGSLKIWDILNAIKEIGSIKENKDMDDNYQPVYEVFTQ